MHHDEEQRRKAARRSADSRANPEEREGAGVEAWLAPLFDDSTLWPLVLVVASCISTLGAAILVAALYHLNLFAVAAMLGIGWICFDVVKRHRRQNGQLGRLGWSLISLWSLSAVIGLAAVALGLV